MDKALVIFMLLLGHIFVYFEVYTLGWNAHGFLVKCMKTHLLPYKESLCFHVCVDKQLNNNGNVKKNP